MPEKNNSFLLINPFGIGDVIFSFPLIANLKHSFPAAKIYYLCNKKAEPILRSHPFLDKIFIYERDEFVAEWKKSYFAGISKYLRFISQIKREKIECSIDLSLNPQFGFFALLGGIKRRLGLDYKKRSRFLNKKIKIDGFTNKHVVDYYLDTLKLLGIPVKRFSLEIYVDSASKEWAQKFLIKNNISKNNLIIGIAPCGGDAFGRDNHLRRWPANQFAALIDKLLKEFKPVIFIFAGPKEKKDVKGITNLLKNRENIFDFSELSLELTAALIEQCELFISNDTGILRMAEGLNKKIIALYGPIDEKVYGPYSIEGDRIAILKKDLPCRPCYRKFRLIPCERGRECLKAISVEDVVMAAGKLLNITRKEF